MLSALNSYCFPTVVFSIRILAKTPGSTAFFACETNVLFAFTASRHVFYPVSVRSFRAFQYNQPFFSFQVVQYW